MKLDKSIVLSILEAAEDATNVVHLPIPRGKEPQQELYYHVHVCAQEGLIFTETGGGMPGDWTSDTIRGLTWKGHEVLAQLRDPAQ